MEQAKLRVIIVEGPDAAGKTALINRIIKKFPGILIKITDRPIDAREEEREKIKSRYRSVIKMIKDNPEVTFILDRFFPSEIVYCKKRGYDVSHDLEFKEYETFIWSKPHLVIFCNPGKEIIRSRIRTRGDDYVTEKENDEMLDRYIKYFSRCPLVVETADTGTEESADKFIETLTKTYRK